MELLTCPKCGSELSADRVNMQSGIASCSSCSAVFTVGAPDAPAYDSSYKDVPQPKRVTVTENSHGLMITLTTAKIKAAFMAFFAIAFDGVFFGMIFPAFIGTGLGSFGFFAVPFVAVGIGVAYYALVLFVNKTYISAANGSLSIKSAPLPWVGNTSLSRKDITQLYVKEQYHRRSSSSGGSRAYYTYDLSVVQSSGARKKLLSLENAETALFFERTIEKHLGIEDAHVSGELQA